MILFRNMSDCVVSDVLGPKVHQSLYSSDTTRTRMAYAISRKQIWQVYSRKIYLLALRMKGKITDLNNLI